MLVSAAVVWVACYAAWRGLFWVFVRLAWAVRGFGVRERKRWQPVVREAVEMVPEMRDARRFVYDLTVRARRSQAAFYTAVSAGSAAGVGAALALTAKRLPWTGTTYVAAALVLAEVGLVAGGAVSIAAYTLHLRWTTEPLQRASLAVGSLFREPKRAGYVTKKHRAEAGHRVMRAFEHAAIPVSGLEELRIASNESDQQWERLRRAGTSRLARAYRGDFVDGESGRDFAVARVGWRTSWLTVAASVATVLGTVIAVLNAWLPFVHR